MSVTARLVEWSTLAFAAAIALLPVTALAWGPEGHSIVAEIAQRRTAHESPAVIDKIQRILGPGVSLASIASWADDFRSENEATSNWHFVDIPIASSVYDPISQCKATPKGDCIIAELDRLRNGELRCKKGDEQKQALMLAVHFLGDIHQPLHTVHDSTGGNSIDVLVFMHGARCKKDCRNFHETKNLHEVWDVTLITMTVWDWGDYVTRLAKGWLAGAEAKKPGIDGGPPLQWALETHQAAQQCGSARPRAWCWTRAITTPCCPCSTASSASPGCGSPASSPGPSAPIDVHKMRTTLRLAPRRALRLSGNFALPARVARQ
jgi:S1/P1 Nuclease